MKGLKNYRRVTDKVYRSACLYRLSEKDRRRLKEDGVGMVVDLRTGVEIEEKPETMVEGIEYVRVPIFSESTLGITRETGTDPGKVIRKVKDRKVLRAMIPDMVDIYRNMATDHEVRSNLEKAVALVLDNKSKGITTLVHCTAGKDRAGVVSALVKLSEGCSREEILSDYLRTNRSTWWESWKKWLLVIVFKGDPVAARMVRKAYSASPEFLEAAIPEIKG